ncbi:hypothetical protein Tco_1028333 [Tanacetum coccineum]|uniref:Uncharacterized protein n=1 Tax=Tanacetum coccineum TaxID=301880 RepID=A0ABQ5G0D3_9ASTR
MNKFPLKKILGINQLTEDTSSFGFKDPIFVKSSADNSDISITGNNIPKSSETKDSNIPNQDTNEVPSNESQRNTTDPSVVVSDSSATDYGSANESLVCSTPLLLLKKLDGAEPGSGPKIIKSILKSKSTFKAETLKVITINKPSSAPARGKSYSASKTNSAPGGKLKNVKMKDDPPLAIVMKELNKLKLQISKRKSSYSRNKNAQQVPPNALQNRYKTQFKMNCDLCGQNNHLCENCYEVLFCKKCKRTNHRTCDHAEFMSSMNANQHHTGQGESFSRLDFQGIQYLFLPAYTVDLMIIILMTVYTIPLVKYVEAMIMTLTITMALSSLGKEKLFKLKMLSLSKQSISEHSNGVPSNKLGPDLNGKAICETQLRGMFGSLMYLTEKYFRYLSVAKKASLVDKVAMFSVETEDIATTGSCANILWT